jgi:hypothetical protein
VFDRDHELDDFLLTNESIRSSTLPAAFLARGVARATYGPSTNRVVSRTDRHCDPLCDRL